jgi:nucleoside-diphosphate-sugar epimerase
MKVLFIGGTGIISSASSALALDRGIDLYLFNRGQTDRPVPAGVKTLQGDIRDQQSAAWLLRDHVFDVVVDWIAFTEEHVRADLELFRDRTGHYIFISSASAYQKPPARLPITEETPLDNPFWEYSRNKIACENVLMTAYENESFPVTIVRPSHTYDRTLLPFRGRYTVVDRLRRGKPIVIHGDGTSIWTLTHHQDFARAFVQLLGNDRAIGQAFHITSDEWLTWNQIVGMVAEAAGVGLQVVHVPSKTVARYDRDWGDSLLGDKSHSTIFDNSKIRQIVPDFQAHIPFAEGAQEIMTWYDANPAARAVDPAFDAMLDRIIADQMAVRPD